MTHNRKKTTTASLRIAKVGVDILWYVGWVAMAMSIGLSILTFTTDFRVKYIHPPLQIDLQAVDESDLIFPATPGSLPIMGFGPVMVEAPSDDPLQPYVLMMPVALLVCYLFVFYHLRVFLRSIVTEGFFTRGNIDRLRRIAWMTLAVGPLWGVMNIVYAKLYQSQVSIGIGEFEPIVDMHPGFMLTGVILLVITRAFEHGLRLQRDNDLTV